MHVLILATFRRNERSALNEQVRALRSVCESAGNELTVLSQPHGAFFSSASALIRDAWSVEPAHVVLALNDDPAVLFAGTACRTLFGWPLIVLENRANADQLRNGPGDASREHGILNWLMSQADARVNVRPAWKVGRRASRGSAELPALSVAATSRTNVPELLRHGVPADTFVCGCCVDSCAPDAEPNLLAMIADACQDRSLRMEFWLMAFGPAREAWTTALRENACDSVRVLGQPPISMRAGFVASCDAWLWPETAEASRLESLPWHLRAAMEARVPILMSDENELSSEMIDREAAFPLPMHNPAALADAILELREFPQACRKGPEFLAGGLSESERQQAWLDLLHAHALPELLPAVAVSRTGAARIGPKDRRDAA